MSNVRNLREMQLFQLVEVNIRALGFCVITYAAYIEAKHGLTNMD